MLRNKPVEAEVDDVGLKICLNFLMSWFNAEADEKAGGILLFQVHFL